MSATMISAIVNRTRNTLDMMHRGNIAQAPNVMKALVRAAEEINKLPEAALVDAEYVKGATEPIIGVCNIHMRGGNFLTAQASEDDGHINLLNEDLDVVILEDTIMFLVNTIRLSICFEITMGGTNFRVSGATALNTWASDNYTYYTRKHGNKTLLSTTGVDAIIKNGFFKKTEEADYHGPNKCVVCYIREARITVMYRENLACCATCMRMMRARGLTCK